MTHIQGICLFLKGNIVMELSERYEVFIKMVTNELGKMFLDQKEFIRCKEGCSYCCESGEYPFSKVEFEYLLKGFNALDNNKKETILNNLKSLNEQKQLSGDEPFMYKCPFLIDSKCSVYQHRGIICRTFGLLVERNDGSFTLPFCYKRGLNYAKVHDDDSNKIIVEKAGKKLADTEPKAYRISRDAIQNLSLAHKLDITWGESKTLLDYMNEFMP